MAWAGRNNVLQETQALMGATRPASGNKVVAQADLPGRDGAAEKCPTRDASPPLVLAFPIIIDRSKSTFETRERTVMPGLCALMGATRLASGYFQHFNPYSSALAHCHISSLAYQPILLGVSPYVLAATRTSVRGRAPRSGLMSLCSYVLMFPALAAAKPRYGVSPYVSYVAYVLMSPR